MSSPSRLVIDPLIYSYPESSDDKRKTSLSNVTASKLFASTSQNNNLSGWTPLITKTFSNDISHNSTPSTKIFPGFYKQNTASGGMGGDFDYPGLNLTPFLTHNLNLNPNSAGNLSNNVNFTPFYDKSMHLTDFFMDSPIRPTPLKVETITPSKFAMSKPFDARLNSVVSLKRSIAQIDTPGRPKKYDVYKDTGSSEDDENKKPYEEFATPSKKKVLAEVNGNLLSKTPLKPAKNSNLYHTPAKVPQVSSPSTVIMSSAAKSPVGCRKAIPPSPTPNKLEVTAEPIMGIFSEKKPKPKEHSRKSQKRQQSGMNRFQIVFTDVHTLMNNRKKKNGEKAEKERSQGRKRTKSPTPQHSQSMAQTQSMAQSSQSMAQPPTFAFHHTSSSLSASQDYNTTMNSSKEFSMLANNSTVNTTNLNLSSQEHSSFELMHGGMVSTPNRKYLLDNLFDKNSPPASHMPPSFHLKNFDGLRHGPQYHGVMPPPKAVSLQHTAQHALRQHEHPQPMVMNMMMSTPQHENVINTHHNSFVHEEMSPSNKESTAYLYHHLHQYQQMNSPNHMHMQFQGQPNDNRPMHMAEATNPPKASRKQRRR